MKAIVYRQYGSPDVLQLRDLTQPSPKDNEVLIKVQAAAVTTADVAARQGSPFIARLAFGLFKPKLSILGTEFAGTIAAIGSSVTRFKPGDAVYAATGDSFGAHREYLCMAEDGAIAPKPNNLNFVEAAALCEGTLTALPFLRDHGKIHQGQKVLINGAAGSVGTAAVQIAKHFGAQVTGVCSSKNLELVKSLGADQVIDYNQADFTQTVDTYDVIFDAVAKSSFSRCKAALKPNGIYLATMPNIAILLQMLWTSKFGSKKAILALTGLRPAKDKAKDLAFLQEPIEAGQLKPVIGQCYSMAQIAEAHRYVETGHKIGSAVITMTPPPAESTSS